MKHILPKKLMENFNERITYRFREKIINLPEDPLNEQTEKQVREDLKRIVAEELTALVVGVGLIGFKCEYKAEQFKINFSNISLDILHDSQANKHYTEEAEKAAFAQFNSLIKVLKERKVINPDCNSIEDVVKELQDCINTQLKDIDKNIDLIDLKNTSVGLKIDRSTEGRAIGIAVAICIPALIPVVAVVAPLLAGTFVAVGVNIWKSGQNEINENMLTIDYKKVLDNVQNIFDNALSLKTQNQQLIINK